MNLAHVPTCLPQATVPGLRSNRRETAELALNNAAWCLRFRPGALPPMAVLELAAALTALAGVYHRQFRPPTPPPTQCCQ